MSDVLIHYVVPVLHVACCVFLVIVVLLQTGKGADMGAVFGGGSQTLFGSSGAGNFLTRLTTGAAIAFMVTSLILTYGASRRGTSSIFDRLPAPAAPTEPAPSPEAQGGLPPLAEPGTPPAPAPATPEPGAAPAPAPAAPPTGAPVDTK
jgi:preprotein translocase subunit SecG